jgi:hypothetical protein
VLFVTACGFPHGMLPSGDGGPSGDDAADAEVPDMSPDAFNPLCYGKAPFSFCLGSPPQQTLTLSGNIDTTACNATTPGGTVDGTVMNIGATSVCLFAATAVDTMGATVGAGGNLPLVIVSTTDITIGGPTTLDARSASDPASAGTGPNANPSDCGTPPSGGDNLLGGGGGAGGTFGTPGGNGAIGGAGAASQGAGGIATPAITPITTLRGGCPGGQGAGGDSAVDGGAGGGAVALFARGKIKIDGVITASGAGGHGGSIARGGGGGGGSGGMIVLHASMITLGPMGKVIANGGGGGGGAGNVGAGGDGEDATVINMPALGSTTTNGGASVGGNGAFKSTGATSPGASANGGGGGGGGVGVIRVLSGQALDMNKVSPPPT